MHAIDPELAGALLGSMRSGLVAIDAAGDVRLLNDEARRILGVSEADAVACIGRPCREVLAAQPTAARLLLDALDGRERPSRAELALAARGAEPARTIGFTLVTVRDAHGALRGSALLFRDLTPFERAGEQERLRERLAALGEMAAGLAHEIRTPLAAMEVMVGLLRRRLVGREDELGLLAELTNELRSLAATVTDGLDFVKPLALVAAPLAVPRLLDEALRIARQRVPFEGEARVDVAADLPVVHGDAEPLRAVLVNLMVNALESLRASGPGGTLHVRARVESVPGAETWAVADEPASAPRGGVTAHGARASASRRELLIDVADDGPGVPPELRERVFYPFFTTKSRGSGLGLALAEKVLAGHGGGIELVDVPRGACFRVRLPADEEPAA